jgi:2-polyprenyl-3-methyl-5-hydroxy-6-metoxy-1,4-benzoquinol methylase
MANTFETARRRMTYATFPRDPESLHSDWYRFYRTLRLLEHVAPGEVGTGTRWFDIGCHSGAFLRAVIDRYAPHASGCDVYRAADKEEQKYECYQLTDNSRWSYRQIDVALEADWGGTFDVISALEVIEHMVDTDQFLDRVRAHLVDNVLFVVTTPNINNLRNRLFVPLGRYPVGLEYRNIIHHVRLYNIEALRSQFAARGFVVLGIQGVQMLPQRWLIRSAPLRWWSERLADAMPQLAANLIVIARKGPLPSAAPRP